jgi:hypothetical protein
MKDVNNTQSTDSAIKVYYNWPLVLSIFVTIFGWIIAYSCLSDSVFVQKFTTTIPDKLISFFGLVFLCFFGVVGCWIYSQRILVINDEIVVSHLGLTTCRFNVESISKAREFSGRLGIGIRLFIDSGKKVIVYTTARNFDLFRIFLDRKMEDTVTARH